MKWFKHDTDMHTDLKIQALIEKHGLEGYAVWNLCLELLGKEGKKGRLMVNTRWVDGLASLCRWSFNGECKVKLMSILDTMSQLRLIDPKSFKYGNLYVPKFVKRIDNYTAYKLRSEFAETTTNISPEQNKNKIKKEIIDRIRTKYIELKDFDIKNFSSDDFGRTAKAIKTLLLKADLKDDLVIKSLEWAAGKKWCDWTLETIIRKWADFMKEQKGSFVPDSLKEFE